MWIVFLLLFLLLVGIVIFLRIAGGGRFPWLQFYTKGKESGFSFHEINLLRRLAIEGRLENPSALFWSIRQLDRSIKELILRMRSHNQVDDPEANHLLGKLFDLRKKVEFDLPRYKLGLKNSRSLVERQKLRLMLPGKGPYAATVVEIRPKYFALSYPQGPELPDGFSWKGQEVAFYFWRLDDAGYTFKSRVIDDFMGKDYPILHVQHADNLVRSQQRKSIRVAMDRPALVYPLSSIGQANETVEASNGLRCRLKDLSEGGAALLIGGRTKVGLPIKLQFDLGGRPTVMNGMVRGVNYNPQKNLSLLHIQAVAPSTRTRNHILAYVYNLFGEQEKVQKKAAPAAGKDKTPAAAPTPPGAAS